MGGELSSGGPLELASSDEGREIVASIRTAAVVNADGALPAALRVGMPVSPDSAQQHVPAECCWCGQVIVLGQQLRTSITGLGQQSCLPCW